MALCNRRNFLKTAVIAAGTAAVGGLNLTAAPTRRAASDLVTLGNSGVKVSRLAFGTGTFSGRVQRELGQEQFTRLVRYAYDSGIRFFETADAYRGMPEMLGIALQGIPRDSYRLMTKFRLNTPEDPKETIDRFRRELKSEYVDILLLHCVRSATWSADHERLRDAFSEVKQKKVIVAHGASCHGLLPLRAFPGNKWLDVALMRVNHNGVKMDSLQTRDTDDLGDVDEVFTHVAEVHNQGTGVLGMKLIGEGRFTNPDDREAAMQKVIRSGAVDAMTIGFKSPAEIDEAIARMNRALNA
ncbi:aldo/keto reductase [Paludibaculum fermentans]|uniref:Aldo/keto reductase n=1 Tax=Paludibaculum fermentans TaxID=1473598 RepID=A0A7S7SL27_PALFE|nr:aldo/keto reductase [Paludibaculum fermentans]QOY87996.1 aldo/keto reductase [Paludibaculum fermentans]